MAQLVERKGNDSQTNNKKANSLGQIMSFVTFVRSRDLITLTRSAHAHAWHGGLEERALLFRPCVACANTEGFTVKLLMLFASSLGTFIKSAWHRSASSKEITQIRLFLACFVLPFLTWFSQNPEQRDDSMLKWDDSNRWMSSEMNRPAYLGDDLKGDQDGARNLSRSGVYTQGSMDLLRTGSLFAREWIQVIQFYCHFSLRRQ